MSFKWWKNEQILFYPHNGPLLSHKKGWITDKCNILGTFWSIMLLKEVRDEGICTICFYVHSILCRQNHDTENWFVVSRQWEREKGDWSQKAGRNLGCWKFTCSVSWLCSCWTTVYMVYYNELFIDGTQLISFLCSVEIVLQILKSDLFLGWECSMTLS
jgi:hypothetical protein